MLDFEENVHQHTKVRWFILLCVVMVETATVGHKPNKHFPKGFEGVIIFLNVLFFPRNLCTFIT